MIENARRQVALVLLVSLVAVVLLFVKDTHLGLDLSGGTQLVYELDLEQAAKDYPNTPPQQILRETLVIINERIDPSGVLDATIQQRGDRQFVIELPNVGRTQAEIIKGQIQNLGKLEMRVLADSDYNEDGVTFDVGEEQQRLKTWLDQDEHRKAVAEDPRAIAQFNALPSDAGGPKSRWLQWYPHTILPDYKDPKHWDYAFSAMGGNEYHVVPAYQPGDYAAGPPQGTEEKPFLVELMPINMHEVHFTGEQMDAGGVHETRNPDDGLPAVAYAFQDKYAGDYAAWSSKYLHKSSAIILNGIVRSAPTFNARIYGRGIITGGFTTQEATDLAKVIKTGSLKVKPELISDVSIGATLGSAAIERGAFSIAAGGVLVLVFILIYYRLAGLVAFLGVMMNVTLIMGVVNFISATLTLPGIAGLVLTMGMAVDANILIYERIREEIARGKDLLQAVRAGFDRAMVTIIDANLTTFIAGLVLYNVGVGPVRGFAVTLMIGILTTLFTAYFVTKVVFHYLLTFKWLKEFRVANWFGNLSFDFIGARWIACGGSLLIIVVGLIYTFFVPVSTKFGLDFTGGASLELALQKPMTAPGLRKKLDDATEFSSEYSSPQVNPLEPDAQGLTRHFNVKVKLSEAQREQLDVLREQAKEAGKEFEPPYKVALRKALDDVLVASAFSEIKEIKDPEANNKVAVADVHFANPVKVADVTSQLQQVLGVGAAAHAMPGHEGEETTPDIRIEFPVSQDLAEPEVREEMMSAMGGLKDTAGNPVELSNPIPNAEEIGPRMVGELQNAAIGALILSMFLIVMYIRIRFHEYKYSVAAVTALVHDVFITYVFVVCFNALGLVSAEIDLAMIAAFLTIIGYSINDTIVIFDRVRENLSDQARLGDTKESFSALLNRSINTTLSRTVLTSGTTLFVVLAQFVVNQGSGSGLEGFSFAFVVGIITGTYSTIFIASPIVLWMKNFETRHKGGRGETATERRQEPVAVQSPV